MSGDLRPYRPSNGTEGEWFHEEFCYRCVRFEECEILDRALFCQSIDDPEYPKEWVTGGGSGPRCTAYVWDLEDPELAAARADPRQGSLGL